MFKELITNYRKRTNDKYLAISDDAEHNEAYQKCLSFLDIFVSEDNSDIHTLSDYITYGENGDGCINGRLIELLSSACDEYEHLNSFAS